MSGSGAEFTEMTGKVIKDAARLAKDVGREQIQRPQKYS